MQHSPGGWADIAIGHERDKEWRKAAFAWEGAKGASVGHNRRDRYERARDRCMAEAEASS